MVGILDGPRVMVRDDVVLLACEAVTNSIRHSDSGTNEQGAVTIIAVDVDDAVRIEIIDARSTRNTPHMLEEDSDALSGRGLRMLSTVSGGRWGTYADDTSRTV